jgi:hypothetical protein
MVLAAQMQMYTLVVVKRKQQQQQQQQQQQIKRRRRRRTAGHRHSGLGRQLGVQHLHRMKQQQQMAGVRQHLTTRR